MKKIIILAFLIILIGGLQNKEEPKAFEKKVVLTFDADLNEVMLDRVVNHKACYNNHRLIDFLIAEKIPATIFLSGLWAKTYPEEVKRMAQDSLLEFGNHSYYHFFFDQKGDINKKREDVIKAEQLIKKLTGQKPNFFRFPGGRYQKNDSLLVAALGYQVINWTMTSGDAFAKKPQQIIANLLKAKNGEIIVLHIGGPNAACTLTALKKAVPIMRKKGIKFIKLSEILKAT